MTLALHTATLPVLSDLAALANDAHRRAEGAAVSALECAREAGEYLTRAKAQCQHGEWLPWLEANFEGSPRAAQQYMRVAERWPELSGNAQRVSHLSLRAALAELAEPHPITKGQPMFVTPPEPPPSEAAPHTSTPFASPDGDEDDAADDAPLHPREWATADDIYEAGTAALEDQYERELAERDTPEPAPKPHVTHNSGENEWYTPPQYLNAARTVMRGIDLDPASSDFANQTVQAARYHTINDDGLTQPWTGRVFMNPPYSGDLVSRFITKLCQHVDDADITQAVVLVNNATETAWFQALLERADAICFPKGRIRYLDSTGQPKQSPLQGQAFLYFGNDRGAFIQHFSPFGVTR
jgi:phage N-6-adenine-methyltransferase